MVSRSYSNLLELTAGESLSFGRINRQIPRIITVAGFISEIGDDPSESVSSEPSSSAAAHDRIIIVANELPIRAHRKSGAGWTFRWDENSLLLQMKDGLGDDDFEVFYVGCLKEDIPPNEQDEVSQILLETFKCVPTFLTQDLYSRYYHGFRHVCLIGSMAILSLLCSENAYGRSFVSVNGGQNLKSRIRRK